MCELGTLDSPAKIYNVLDILLYPLKEFSKDFLPAVTKNDKGSFTDRIALISLPVPTMGRKAFIAISRAVEYWKYYTNFNKFFRLKDGQGPGYWPTKFFCGLG